MLQELAALQVILHEHATETAEFESEKDADEVVEACKLGQSSLRTSIAPCTESVVRGKVRFMNWNIEWMSHFFATEGVEILDKNIEAGLNDIPALAGAIAKCILEMDPDVLSIEEGPPSSKQMDLFIATYLQGRYAAIWYVAQQRRARRQYAGRSN
jgi:hypothetical protein